MTEEQIRHMTEQFLRWSLPDDFYPDGGISFKRILNENTSFPSINKPVGTNLLTYTQAEAMVKAMIKDLPNQQSNTYTECTKKRNPQTRLQRSLLRLTLAILTPVSFIGILLLCARFPEEATIFIGIGFLIFLGLAAALTLPE